MIWIKKCNFTSQIKIFHYNSKSFDHYLFYLFIFIKLLFIPVNNEKTNFPKYSTGITLSSFRLFPPEGAIDHTIKAPVDFLPLPIISQAGRYDFLMATRCTFDFSFLFFSWQQSFLNLSWYLKCFTTLLRTNSQRDGK